MAVFLNVLDYPMQHQLHMAAALSDLFEDIKERTQSELIRWDQVTSFFVQSLKEDPTYEQSQIPHRHKPSAVGVGNSRAIESILQCKDIEDLAPVIVGHS